MNIFILIPVMICLPVLASGIKCGKGEYKDPSAGICKPCVGDTFMDEEKHQNTECRWCTKKNKHYHQEKVLEKCTRTKDTILGCIDGYYLHYSPLISRTECSICRNCTFEPVKKFTGKNCTIFTDTVCCPHPQMTVSNGICLNPPADSTESIGTDKDVTNESLLTGPPRIDSSLPPRMNSTLPPMLDKNTCGRNEFLNSSGNSCMPCPRGSVRLQLNHTFDFCEKCTSCSSCENEIAVIIVPSIGFVVIVIVILVIVYALWKYMQCHGKNRGEYHLTRQNEGTSRVELFSSTGMLQ